MRSTTFDKAEYVCDMQVYNIPLYNTLIFMIYVTIHKKALVAFEWTFIQMDRKSIAHQVL